MFHDLSRSRNYDRKKKKMNEMCEIEYIMAKVLAALAQAHDKVVLFD